MDLGIRDRSAVVGGASAGIGRAVADELAAEGCRLLLWSRSRDNLEPVAASLRTMYGTEVHVFEADAGDIATAERVAFEAESRLGGADILILNAGGPAPVDPLKTSADDWRASLQMLTVTPIDIATRLIPYMQVQSWGRIVGILSSSIRQPIVDLAYSSGGRAALALWLKTAATALAADGVTVNGVLPGRIDTPRVAALDERRATRQGVEFEELRKRRMAEIPMGRYGQPRELAALVAFLCSDRASLVTGSFIAADGGMITDLR